jgi:hypothetical protein
VQIQRQRCRCMCVRLLLLPAWARLCTGSRFCLHVRPVIAARWRGSLCAEDCACASVCVCVCVSVCVCVCVCVCACVCCPSVGKQAEAVHRPKPCRLVVDLHRWLLKMVVDMEEQPHLYPLTEVTWSEVLREIMLKVLDRPCAIAMSLLELAGTGQDARLHSPRTASMPDVCLLAAPATKGSTHALRGARPVGS